ncbi:hypothetical protein NEIMUCOT_04203 [Neisseria mucosa ATCC 25996]|uniref:Uncharacterized protein n=1 Tax=Neisseria mucosa (strain ATCC 25996 / DSM 4631 / NCTC 10774 / M26) TaxID=546266 RepID=D2ZUB5_NEIM2|nr:hypothetical protein NEIMUCOT_04203 [Neisseria mucosa ATCC 25996]
MGLMRKTRNRKRSSENLVFRFSDDLCVHELISARRISRRSLVD